MFHESSRWFLLLGLLLIPIWYRWSRRANPSVLFSSTGELADLGRSWKLRLRFLPGLIRTLALIVLIVALARPRKGNEETRVMTEGIAIQLLVDRSGSMLAHDFTLEGKRVDRLTAVKTIVKEFVLGDTDVQLFDSQVPLAGRPDDLIGLITFARYADSKCPLTLDHAHLVKSLETTELAKSRAEDGTAIGDALTLAVEKLQNVERQQNLSDRRKIKTKIVILLTDGENNIGDIDPLKAAEVAKTYGIKVYTIGAGTKGQAPVPTPTPFGVQLIPQQVRIDEATLRKIAEMTDGQYFRATDSDSLRNVYAEIDNLEKTETIERRYLQYSEWATETIETPWLRLPPLLLMVFILLAAELLLRQTLFRRLP